MPEFFNQNSTPRGYNTQGIPVDSYIDTVSPTVEYIGTTTKLGALTSEPVFQIQKKTVSGTVEIYKWADDSDAEKFVWDDRATYF